MKIQFLNNPILIIFLLLNIINVASNQADSCAGLNDCYPCDSTEASGICPSCKAGYFSFFNGLLCLSCQDPLYG